MSLLMDALKRAETSKQNTAGSQGGSDAVAASETLRLEPLTSKSNSPLPELADHIHAVDADLATSARPASSTAPRPAPPPIQATAAEAPAKQIEREAIRNAFSAKQPAAEPSKKPLWWVLGLLGLTAIAISAYVWFQVNNIGGTMQAPTSPRSAPTQPAASQGAPAPALQVSPPAVFAQNSPSTVAVASRQNEARLITPSPAEYRPNRELMTDIAPSAGAPIRLTRTTPAPDNNLLNGHTHIQRNELESARTDYESALLHDPNNTDALLALAAIAQRQGRPGDAERFNQRALIANPSDAASQAAALNSPAAGADPQNTESRLKILLSAQPESAQLNFALGNLYARQKRWPDAQQFYFNAVAAESDNPDYLFNLAVSLDHIRQTRPAAQHYRLALEAANKRPGAFDREQVRKRISQLQPDQPVAP